jgi:RNA polymerase sigma-70 factor, ECF subfamily
MIRRAKQAARPEVGKHMTGPAPDAVVGSSERARDGSEPPATSPEERALLEALRNGNEDGFASLVELYNASLLRLAMMYVGNRAVAEEVVQETWLGLLESLDRFEQRASLKTWIYRILVNSAKKRRGKEARSIPFSSLWEQSTDVEPAVDPDRFLDAGHRWAHHWESPPRTWVSVPEAEILSKETLARVDQAIAALPPAQREVITLRDVQGWTAAEACNVLGLTETNQRVLLHRARSKVRRDLERYLSKDENTG